MESEKQIYRAEINSIFLPIIQFASIAGFIFLMAISYKEDFQYNPKMLDAVLIFVSILIPILLLIFIFFTFYNRIIITISGISAISPYSNPPKRSFISWDSVKKVQYRNVMGYHYYLLCGSENEKAVWVPKRIKDKERFYETVRSIAGNNNIFTIELMKL